MATIQKYQELMTVVMNFGTLKDPNFLSCCPLVNSENTIYW